MFFHIFKYMWTFKKMISAFEAGLNSFSTLRFKNDSPCIFSEYVMILFLQLYN